MRAAPGGNAAMNAGPGAPALMARAMLPTGAQEETMANRALVAAALLTVTTMAGGRAGLAQSLRGPVLT